MNDDIMIDIIQVMNKIRTLSLQKKKNRRFNFLLNGDEYIIQFDNLNNNSCYISNKVNDETEYIIGLTHRNYLPDYILSEQQKTMVRMNLTLPGYLSYKETIESPLINLPVLDIDNESDDEMFNTLLTNQFLYDLKLFHRKYGKYFDDVLGGFVLPLKPHNEIYEVLLSACNTLVNEIENENT